jgi:hypothetical protein
MNNLLQTDGQTYVDNSPFPKSFPVKRIKYFLRPNRRGQGNCLHRLVEPRAAVALRFPRTLMGAEQLPHRYACDLAVVGRKVHSAVLRLLARRLGPDEELLQRLGADHRGRAHVLHVVRDEGLEDGHAHDVCRGCRVHHAIGPRRLLAEEVDVHGDAQETAHQLLRKIRRGGNLRIACGPREGHGVPEIKPVEHIERQTFIIHLQQGFSNLVKYWGP